MDYLSVRGLKTAGKKIELVARAFTAMKMKMEIIENAEEQKKLDLYYKNLIKELNTIDPKKVPMTKRINNVTPWPRLTMGRSYILVDFKKERLYADYIGKYKDKKTFFFDGGFVGPALVYKVPKSDITFCYSEVTASQINS